MVEARSVRRMRGNRDQCVQRAGRQFRVAVERDHVRRAVDGARPIAEIDERQRTSFGEPTDQLHQLAALAFPTDPALFGFRPAPIPVQQQEIVAACPNGGG